VALGIAWFLVTVLVESSVIPIVDLMYEHRAYLPSVGILVAASTALALAVQRLAPASAGRVLSLTGLGVALVLASATLARNAVWQSDVVLWADAASKAPAKFRTHLNLGSALVAAGRLDEGAAVLRRAVELDPSSATARVALGAAQHRAGRAAEAEASYREALRLAPDAAQARFNLAELLWSRGRRAEAVPLYRQFLERTGPAESAVRGVASARLAAAGAAGGTPPLPEEPPAR
jgi:tetratricopeptide (TPR) repeat protein